MDSNTDAWAFLDGEPTESEKIAWNKMRDAITEGTIQNPTYSETFIFGMRTATALAVREVFNKMDAGLWRHCSQCGGFFKVQPMNEALLYEAGRTDSSLRITGTSTFCERCLP